MCQQQDHDNSQNTKNGLPGLPEIQSNEPFPWHLGVFDAHCHPTDTMGSIADIPGMKARALTIMATRSQDQHLVAEVASSHSLQDRTALQSTDQQQPHGKLVPSFGWHPWFSHQLYDNSSANPTYREPKTTTEEDQLAAKTAHYQAVLSPPPTDPLFLSSLPLPTAFSAYLTSTRSHLRKHPHALIGEVGLDKAFRLPRHHDGAAPPRDEGLTPGGREGRMLTPQRVAMPHQRAVLDAQLRLAGELDRAVSVHGVQAHGVLLETVAGTWKGWEKELVSRRQRKKVAKGAEPVEEEEEEGDGNGRDSKRDVGGKPFPPRICLHSFSGSAEVLKQWLHPSIPARVFFSFSTAVNLGTEAGRSKVVDVVRAVPDDSLLVESDLHIGGGIMDDALEDIYRRVCEMKGWGLEEGVRRIGRNYEEFIFG